MTEDRSAPARIMVVDDVEVNRDLLSRRLQRMGHVVTTANDGQEALDLTRDPSWDLIMLDVMMPVLDGIGALTALKASDATRHIPVIMISANTELETVVKCIELGAEDYLPKPFDPVLLRARVGASLEKKRLRDREQARSRRMQKELEVGARIQRDFLPESLPTVPGYQFAARFEPAREVGGDFYDAFRLPDGAVALVLGDVCDKGVGAALFMALFRSLIRAVSASQIGSHTVEMLESRVLHAVTVTNDYIANTHGRANMFATLFVGALDPATGTIAYVNGGHEPPRVVRANGTVRTMLPPTGPAVGMLPEIPFTAGTIVLEPGETLLVLTDGITESRAPNGLLFGDDATDALLSAPADSVDALLDRVLDAVHGHAAGEPAADDVTLLAVRRG
ncbi:PP2C family protein-serine/threonine phosphatase [Gemmatimonas groenlandica]|uniref:SpoIIE family protein phosphatase n=1 Tax=Gemmatimonas groenlandica TaxID=2732249 RepID=A0A6M4IPV8_9BACT|nr:SpoIIE family protein phosphatase [Gemmatimonas groenlandica]QJR36115.1 SpoIIE family protein phosphatase [Gemmatimonas groenlandica]